MRTSNKSIDEVEMLHGLSLKMRFQQDYVFLDWLSHIFLIRIARLF